jgi:cell division transport system permease protein
MKSKPYVAGVKLVTKDEALALYKEENKQDPLLLELVTADILPASLEVSGKEIGSLDQIQQDLSHYNANIEEIVYQKNIVDSLSKWTRTIRVGGAVAIAVLALTSVVIVVIIISMKVAMKRQEIGIMRLLGATTWYINGPFVFEAMWYGCFSALISWGIVTIAVLYATPWVLDFFGEIQVIPSSWIFFVLQGGVGLLFGALIGGIASSIALRRFIK